MSKKSSTWTTLAQVQMLYTPSALVTDEMLSDKHKTKLLFRNKIVGKNLTRESVQHDPFKYFPQTAEETNRSTIMRDFVVFSFLRQFHHFSFLLEKCYNLSHQSLIIMLSPILKPPTSVNASFNKYFP